MTSNQQAVKQYLEEAAEILSVEFNSSLSEAQWVTLLEIAGMLQLEHLQARERMQQK